MNDFLTNSENLAVAEFAAAELAAAELSAELGKINPAYKTRITNEKDAAVAYLVHYGVSATLDQVDCELTKARVGQSRWKEIKLDLSERPQCGFFPIDFCPEISPELASYYKGPGKADLKDFGKTDLYPMFPLLGESAEVLGIQPRALVRKHWLPEVNRSLNKLADRVSLCMRMREALRLAMAKQARIKRAEQNRIALQGLLSRMKAEGQRQSQDQPAFPEDAVSQSGSACVTGWSCDSLTLSAIRRRR